MEDGHQHFTNTLQTILDLLAKDSGRLSLIILVSEETIMLGSAGLSYEALLTYIKRLVEASCILEFVFR